MSGVRNMTKVGIVAKSHLREATPHLTEIEAWLIARGREPMFETATAALMPPSGTRKVADKMAMVAMVDLVVVLGGDGTMLRALQQMLGSGVPCLGVNYGRVGFLTSIEGDELETRLEAAFGGAYEVLELPTIVADHGDRELVGINDIVLTSSILGRMAMLEWRVGGQTLGEVACDGAILATPTGSTAYNLSAGGPVLAWGLEGFVLSFISPHSLHARSMVLGRPHHVELVNRSEDVPLEIIVDGHVAGRLDSAERLSVSMGGSGALLARALGMSFFARYRSTFST
jgi:NAD+ kinase